ncbi:hypothetical protein QEJ31_10250 [Pigmentibacter sp. JX0631]|uniref:hypothetical protein n=1 Tax=Pigmentibacter sp. JX0631 TaxID=2976982 RepID=UPI002468FDFF|nr:hypothetical protein [Pigmentibacter sp. JX0631]WGL58903.1 hypothetical protein QEJ31_10250 [Pigmentibacter sp. JX0631]
MNMKPMQKSAIKPIPSAKNFQHTEKSSFLKRLFGFESQKVVNTLRAENQELILMNQRNMDSIKTLSDQLAECLSFQQNNIQVITERLKIMENLPAKQEALHEKIMDSFDRATFFIQNASQDLVQAKSNFTNINLETIENSGIIEIAEFMRSFLINNLLSKQIQTILFNIIDEKMNLKDAEAHCLKLQKNIQIVSSQISQINFKLEKYNFKIEDSLWKAYAPELQTAEVTEHCSPEEFQSIIKLSQKVGIFDENDKIKSLVISETLPAISVFSKEKSSWVVKRRAKVVVLKPT